MLLKTRVLPKARVEEIDALLQKKEQVGNHDPSTHLLDCVSVEFSDHAVADFRVLDGDNGPYLDPTLWDQFGNELVCLDTEVFSSIVGRFVFDGKDFEAHEVILLRAP